MNNKEIKSYGEFKETNDDIYIGEMVNGNREGMGILKVGGYREFVGEFRGNKKNGYFEAYRLEEFHKEKYFEGYYKEDEKHGFAREYSYDGSIKEGNYENGKLVGVWKTFKDGILCEEIEYFDEYKYRRYKVYYNSQYGSIPFEYEKYYMKMYNGFSQWFGDTVVYIDFYECTEEEREEILEVVWGSIETFIEDESEEKVNRLYALLGTKEIEEKHSLMLIEKYIESNFEEDGFLSEIVGFLFFHGKVEAWRYEENLDDISEYARGKYCTNRFDCFGDYLNKDLFYNVISKVKDIYFRRADILEFINSYIQKESRRLFISIQSLRMAWNAIQEYISIENDKNIDLKSFYDGYSKNNNNLLCDTDMKNLSLYLKIMNKKYNFDNQQEAILVSWLVLYYKTIEYLSNEFFDKYCYKYKAVSSMSLEECIDKYIETLYFEQEMNIIRFTCFLLDKRKIINRKSFITSEIECNIFKGYKIVKELIVKRKEKKDIEDFEKYIMDK